MFLKSNFLLLNKIYNRITFSKLQGVNMSQCMKSGHIVWMDLEMTGLDVQKDNILELSCLITDQNLNIIDSGISVIINHPNEVFEKMNVWCINHHNKSGLVEKCKNSKLNTAQAESVILDYLKKMVPQHKCPLAGNSVYMDRMFLNHHMPSIHEYLHYRIIDVSTIKELCSRWNKPVLNSAPQKMLQHRSLDDINESIEELKYYRNNFFKNNVEACEAQHIL